jgi:ribosomal protein S18 acetylase RimI-like enzyme
MIKVTPANIDQIKIIQEIAYRTWPATFSGILSPEQIDYMLDMMYSDEALQAQISNLNHCFLLAAQGDTYLGFLSYETPYKGEAKTKIHKIYILPEAQGLGVGKKLMETVENIALKKGDQLLLLNVNKHNEAEKFYKHLGFETIATEDIDIGSGFLMEDKIMAKKIIR